MLGCINVCLGGTTTRKLASHLADFGFRFIGQLPQRAMAVIRLQFVEFAELRIHYTLGT